MLFFQVQHIQGHGTITSPNEVIVAKKDGSTEVVKSKNIMIATGSEVTPFPGLEVSIIEIIEIDKEIRITCQKLYGD